MKKNRKLLLFINRAIYLCAAAMLMAGLALTVAADPVVAGNNLKNVKGDESAVSLRAPGIQVGGHLGKKCPTWTPWPTWPTKTPPTPTLPTPTDPTPTQPTPTDPTPTEPTETETETVTPTETETETETPTETVTPTEVETETETPTETETIVPTETLTVTPTETETLTVTPTETETVVPTEPTETEKPKPPKTPVPTLAAPEIVGGGLLIPVTGANLKPGMHKLTFGGLGLFGFGLIFSAYRRKLEE